MNITKRIIFLLLIYGCRSSSTQVIEFNSIIAAIDDRITECSNFVNPTLKIHTQDSIFNLEIEKLPFLRKKYALSYSKENSRINFSINLKKKLATVVVTCDYPKIKNQTSEPTTILFKLSKKNNRWMVVSKEDMN